MVVTSILTKDVLSLVGFEEENWHVTKDWGRSLDNNQQETETLTMIACKKLSATDNPMSLEADPSPLETQLGLQP
jgi:hypothetical protein